LNLDSLQKAAKAGDEQAEKNLLAILSERFLLFANHKIWNDEDSREIVQEALLTVLGTYKTIEIHTSFAAWAQRVLENRILSYYRTKKVRGKYDGGDIEDHPEPTAVEVEPELKKRLLVCLEKVGKISRHYARVLNLHYQGFSTGEICDRLEITDNNCYVILSRSRNLLKTCLEKRETKP
jgi:RNA polymerase sigma factor (sigma-70 family)